MTTVNPTTPLFSNLVYPKTLVTLPDLPEGYKPLWQGDALHAVYQATHISWRNMRQDYPWIRDGHAYCLSFPDNSLAFAWKGKVLPLVIEGPKPTDIKGFVKTLVKHLDHTPLGTWDMDIANTLDWLVPFTPDKPAAWWMTGHCCSDVVPLLKALGGIAYAIATAMEHSKTLTIDFPLFPSLMPDPDPTLQQAFDAGSISVIGKLSVALALQLPTFPKYTLLRQALSGTMTKPYTACLIAGPELSLSLPLGPSSSHSRLEALSLLETIRWEPR